MVIKDKCVQHLLCPTAWHVSVGIESTTMNVHLLSHLVMYSRAWGLNVNRCAVNTIEAVTGPAGM